MTKISARIAAARWSAGACCAMLLLALVAEGKAQAPATPASAAPAAVEPAKASPIQIHGSIRTRLEMWDWFGGTDASTYAYSGNIVKLSFAQTGKHTNWKVELAAPILAGLPDDAQIAGAQGQLGLGASYFAANDRNRNAAMIFPKQAYLEFHHMGPGEKHGVKIGRFEFVDGTELTPKNATLAALKRTRIFQRLIGAFAWTHVGRSFDGAHYTWNGKGKQPHRDCRHPHAGRLSGGWMGLESRRFCIRRLHQRLHWQSKQFRIARFQHLLQRLSRCAKNR
ncbi:MAG: hypothetical protein U5J83_06915 [Bryobacterales bacterium]|nr:hypothetical protein [Bryobacterales bacterium]